MMPQTVLVTGGAKRLGAAIARRLVGEGCGVVIHHNASADAAESLARELTEAGGRAVAVAGDLSDPKAIDGLFQRACEAAGGEIDGLVNSASAFIYDRPPEIDTSLLLRLTAINLAAPAALASALARQPGLERGAVVNFLDQKVANPNPDFFSYSTTKFALAGATTMLAQALAPRIAVNALSPGLTLPSGDQTEAEFAAVASENLLRRPVGVDAITGAVAFLLGARGVTGQNLFVDCGQRFLSRDGDVMFEGGVLEGGAHG